eukprot:3763525-Rhodomonas_salina.1
MQIRVARSRRRLANKWQTSPQHDDKSTGCWAENERIGAHAKQRAGRRAWRHRDPSDPEPRSMTSKAGRREGEQASNTAPAEGEVVVRLPLRLSDLKRPPGPALAPPRPRLC